MSQSLGRYLLTIEAIPPLAPESPPADAAPPFPAYFVGSTAPNNVEDGVRESLDPAPVIHEMAQFLSRQQQPELLIAVHGYNTALGTYAPRTPGQPPRPGTGVKGWYQDIRNHMARHCPDKSAGLVLVGYRWPSEQIKGIDNDTLGHKLRYARQSLPTTLKVIVTLALVTLALVALGGLSLVALTTDLPGSVPFALGGIGVLIAAIIALTIVFTFFLLRIAGYFRDAYRAQNFGIPDLVEFVRQLDKAVVEVDPKASWPDQRRIQLSFIGHSMGGFVVTDTVRILSDVFDTQSIGYTTMAANKAKHPSANIGNVFCLGRLVLVSPDIPAETIVSGRANFLSSSLRRFKETYLFSNEGDMALKLASTAANYASFPARTREGGYRLGNVVVRSPKRDSIPSSSSHPYGVLNLDPATGQLLAVQPRATDAGVEPKKITLEKSGQTVQVSSFLQYLYILGRTSLLQRQTAILDPDQKPIAELFTVFDCTDYFESVADAKTGQSQRIGMLSQALGKRSLNFLDYVSLSLKYFTGKIDTHGGYFYSAPPGPATDPSPRPDAALSKRLIYGLACLGFKSFVTTLASGQEGESPAPGIPALLPLSQLCGSHGIQVLLAAERYNRDILGIVTEGGRNGY
jgi:hypothetical protein